MVTPLLVISVFLSGKANRFLFLKKPVLRFALLGKERILIMSNLIASIIFFITGIVILYLKAIGKLGMGDITGFTKYITNTEGFVNNLVGGNMIINLLFVGILGGFTWYILREVRKK